MAAHDPGHIALASLGLMTGLLRTLVNNGVLTKEQGNGVVQDVLDQMAKNPDVATQAGVIEVLRQTGLVT